MGWKATRASLEQSRALKMERVAVRELGAQLKNEMSDISARISQMNDDFKRVRELWSNIEAPTNGARKEFALLRTEIHGYSDIIMELLTNSDEEFYDVVMAIGKTPKTHVDQLLTLTRQLHRISRIKLENDVPRCQEMTTLREQSIQRLRDIAESEQYKRGS